MDGGNPVRRVPPVPPSARKGCSLREREKKRRKIEQLPANLSDALDCLEKDDVVKNAMGEHIHEHFVQAKRAEWGTYISRVHPWEVDEYLQAY